MSNTETNKLIDDFNKTLIKLNDKISLLERKETQQNKRYKYLERTIKSLMSNILTMEAQLDNLMRKK